MLDQTPYFVRRRRRKAGHDQRDGKIDHRTNNTKSIGFNSKKPIRREVAEKARARNKHNALVLKNVDQSDTDTRQHSQYRALSRDTLRKYPQKKRWK